MWNETILYAKLHSNGNLVAIGKFITPIEKTNVTTIILEIALDF